jgi:hypothetical protein
MRPIRPADVSAWNQGGQGSRELFLTIGVEG